MAPSSMELRHRLAFQAFLAKDVKKAGFITTISQGTSKKMEAYFGREADEIIYPSIQNHFSKSLEETEDVLSEFKISKSFILTVGTFEPRKICAYR